MNFNKTSVVTNKDNDIVQEAEVISPFTQGMN